MTPVAAIIKINWFHFKIITSTQNQSREVSSMKKEKMKVTTFVRNKDYYYVIRTIQIIPHYPLRLRIIYSLFVTPISFRYNLGIK